MTYITQIMATLHTFQDDSKLYKINVRELLAIPVWRGNRHIDIVHAESLRKEIGSNISFLDASIFRTIRYNEDGIDQKYLIDGQHRRYVLQKYFEENLSVPDFEIILIEKTVDDESGAIEYFNVLNNVKPQHESDTKLMANKYICELEKTFNTNKKSLFIRPPGKNTKRPYLSSDVLRKELEVHSNQLKQSPRYIAQFIQKVQEWNIKKVIEYTNTESNEKVLKSCLEKNFMLAYDTKLSWVGECLA